MSNKTIVHEIDATLHRHRVSCFSDSTVEHGIWESVHSLAVLQVGNSTWYANTGTVETVPIGVFKCSNVEYQAVTIEQ